MMKRDSQRLPWSRKPLISGHAEMRVKTFPDKGRRLGSGKCGAQNAKNRQVERGDYDQIFYR
jgi:hypothetical protein